MTPKLLRDWAQMGEKVRVSYEIKKCWFPFLILGTRFEIFLGTRFEILVPFFPNKFRKPMIVWFGQSYVKVEEEIEISFIRYILGHKYWYCTLPEFTLLELMDH